MTNDLSKKRWHFTPFQTPAIILIALVIAFITYLFILGPKGEASVSIACVSVSGFYCSHLAVSHNGTLSFVFMQITGSTLYNISFACLSGSQNATINSTYWANAASLNSSSNDTLRFEVPLRVTGLQCYSNDSILGSKINSTNFNGNLWIRYKQNHNALQMSLWRVADIQILAR